MEDVSTGVLEKKEYLRSKDKAKKWYDVSRHIIAYVKIQKNEDIQSSMSNLIKKNQLLTH